jgi:enamine deaminase RidA (YjgF/YER057c/UK114 family)
VIEYFRTPRRSLRRDLPPDATIVSLPSRLVMFSGVQSWGETGVLLGQGDAGEQVRVTMRNIEGMLTDLGGSLSDIAKAVLYVVTSDDANMGSAWEAYVEVMGDRQPATTLVGVTMLGSDPDEGEPFVEIEVTAALG